jgi:hypothetical protein
MRPVARPSADCLEHLVRNARVPVWLPWPLPQGWLVTGFAYAGDERTGALATVVACSGPSPLGGAGELLLVAEEPGIGLGARYAGLPGPDPGDGLGVGAPHAKIEAAGHPTALWCLDAPQAATYVGEAKGNWLWAVLWPESAGVLLLEDLHLRDLRSYQPLPDLPYGALSPRLTAEPVN